MGVDRRMVIGQMGEVGTQEAGCNKQARFWKEHNNLTPGTSQTRLK